MRVTSSRAPAILTETALARTRGGIYAAQIIHKHPASSVVRLVATGVFRVEHRGLPSGQQGSLKALHSSLRKRQEVAPAVAW